MNKLYIDSNDVEKIKRVKILTLYRIAR